MGPSALLTALILALRLVCLDLVYASPSIDKTQDYLGPFSSSWWFSEIKRQGFPAFGKNPDYKLFRNVRDFGAKGDGRTDDTVAINKAISTGPNRCGRFCDSNTITPAIIYFPPGVYVVTKPIIPYYYTQLVGDANTLPTLRAGPGFEGIAVIDSDPYADGGVNWWTNQNNFFRQVRNFKIDLTALPMSTGTGIHWQVAQATSLQNIEFHMVKDRSQNNKQQGIFMDNGSGGFMSDLAFFGGRYGAFLGNQQFTTRNLTFDGCNTAIYMNWNWVWTFHGLAIKNCAVGIDMANGGPSQTVGSIVVLDSTFADTDVAIATAFTPIQRGTNGTLVLDNIDMTKNVPIGVLSVERHWRTLLPGNAHVSSWIQGRSYKGSSGMPMQSPADRPVAKPGHLLGPNGRIFTRSKPQYESIPATRFISAKSKGAKGDGKTDDTHALQALFDELEDDEVAYIDHGAYLVTDTVRIGKKARIVGEIWPLILAGGDRNFKDQSQPKPVFQVGEKGDIGTFEMQDIMFETDGPQPGAILMRINMRGEYMGTVALWDVHFRVGGSEGTRLQLDRCAKNPTVTADANPDCLGAFMMVHVTEWATPYLENVWMWTADHELDLPPHTQLNIFTGRGILIESIAGTWLWGTASEHNVLSNYQLNKAQNVFMGLIQSETAYFQPNPDATKPFVRNPDFADPGFSNCRNKAACARTWGLRINDSKNVLVYGAGLYSFFDNYDQKCVAENNCQENMVGIFNSQVEMFGISTKASINMISQDGASMVKDIDNRNNFCAAIAAYSPQ